MATTNERITVHLDPATSEAKLRDVAGELAIYFNISVEEAQNLLSADVILLERPQAEALVSICKHLGVRGTLNKKRLKSPLAARLSDNAVPLLLAVLSVVVVLAVGALMLPSLEPVEDFITENVTERGFATVTSAAESEPAEQVIESQGAGSGKESEVARALPLPEVSSERLEPAESPSEDEEERPNETEPSLPLEARMNVPAPVVVPARSASVPSQPIIEPDLFTAARDLPAQEVERLLALFPMLELRDAYGQTPLMYAAGNNSAQAVRALLDAGADVNARSKAGWTPLMYAARNRDATVTQVLLAAGADLSLRNESGQVARDIALANNNPGTAGVLAVASRALAEQQARWARPAAAQRVATEPAPSSPQAVPVGYAQALPEAPATSLISSQRSDEQRRVLESCLSDWESCGSN